ncbi:hypothetical protein, partial [Escherichia coli]|uniref:hypothetical protein n=1 Tax=Escherichia coli TaxID=562 RepID=UPI001BE45E71
LVFNSDYDLEALTKKQPLPAVNPASLHPYGWSEAGREGPIYKPSKSLYKLAEERDPLVYFIPRIT